MKFPTRSVRTWVLALLLAFGTTSTLLAGVIPQLPTSRISDAGAEVSGDFPASIVEKNGILHAVWLDKRDGAFRGVYYANSSDQGVTWSANRRVAPFPDVDWANEPSVAVDNDGTIWVLYHVFYLDGSETVNDLYLARSVDNGATFTTHGLYDGHDGDTDQWRSRLVANESTGMLHALIQDYATIGSDEGMNIFIARIDPSNLAGGTLAPVSDAPATGRIGDGANAYGGLISLDERAGKICAAWEDRRERFSIYGACSTDGGLTYGANFRISPSDSLQPEIAIAPNGDLYTIYVHDGSSTRDLYLRRSTDNGVSWGPERTVASFASDVIAGWDIAVDANGQIVTTFFIPGYGDNTLYIGSSVDNGESFALTPLVLEDEDPTGTTITTAGSGVNSRAYVAFYGDDNDLRVLRLALDGIAPTTPANLSATGVERAVQLTWNASTDANGVIGYHVYRATSAAGPFSQMTQVPTPSTTWVDVDLSPGTTYFYQVRAFDSTGNRSPQSNTTSAAATALGAPQYTGALAYESGNNVRIQNLAGGDAQTIATAYAPLFSPDGAKLYFSSGAMIQRRALAGGATETFFEDPEHSLFDIAANENDFVTIIARTLPSTVTGGFCFLFEPRVARPGVELYVALYEWARDVAITSDGKIAAYTSSGWCNAAANSIYYTPRLCLIDVAAGDEECMIFGEIAEPDFAAGGRTMVFASDASGQFEIWRAEVTENRQLVNHTQLTRGAANQPSRAPAFSSDGQWVVFQRDMDPGDQEDWQLYIVRADGVGVRSLGIAGEEPVMHGGGGVIPGALRTFLPSITK